MAKLPSEVAPAKKRAEKALAEATRKEALEKARMAGAAMKNKKQHEAIQQRLEAALEKQR